MKNIAIMAAMVFATATGANADAFGECGAKIAVDEVAANNDLGPAAKAILTAGYTRELERNMTDVGKGIKKMLDGGKEYAQIEYDMIRAGADEQILRILRLCQHEL